MDKVLKQRLIGATILIALAVIFLPMLFDGGEGDLTPRQLALDLPERPDVQREVRRLPLDPDQVRTPREAEAEPPIQPEAEQVDEPEPPSTIREERQVQPVEPAPATEPEPEPEPEPAPVPDSPPAQAAADGHWVVQVAVFSNRASAERIGARLEELGHRFMLDTMVRDQAELHRLRTGPYASREDAQTAHGQIVATVAGVEPVVRSLAPVEAEDPLERAGYAVQVGSFASRNNADRLVASLSDSGLEAYIHSEPSGGRTIHRVRVGRFAQRQDAEALLERLRDEVGLEGIVVGDP